MEAVEEANGADIIYTPNLSSDLNMGHDVESQRV